MKLSLTDILPPKYPLHYPVPDIQSAQIVDSIAKTGIIRVPVLVRRTEGFRQERASWELVDGQRRLSAAWKCIITQIPAHEVIAENDVDLLTIQIESNLSTHTQLDSLLMKLIKLKPGCTLLQLASGINQSVDWVYIQLGLVNLIPYAKLLLNDEVLTLHNARSLARLVAVDQKANLAAAIELAPDIFAKQIAQIKRSRKHLYNQKFKFTKLRRRHQTIEIRKELTGHHHATKLIMGCKTKLDVWDMALRWVLREDPMSQQDQQLKQHKRKRGDNT